MFRFDRRLIENFDWIFLLLFLLIFAMSLANLFSSTWIEGHPGPSGYFMKQLYFYLIGLMLMVLLIAVDYLELMKFEKLFYGGVVGLLIYVDLSGQFIAGTQRWINLGFFHLQPSEPAKIFLVITLASYYSQRDNDAGYGLKDLFVPVFLTGLPFVLILIQPDLGTALMLGILFLSMTLFVKLQRSTIVSMGSVGAILAIIGWNFLLKPYQRARIETFLHPESDPMNNGYQVMQSKIAMGSGQFLGKGFLEGTQGHLHFLPERHTDFAFAVWAEEWGFSGSLFFLGCYFAMLLWGIHIAMTARDKFGVLLAFGLVMLIFWQAIINLGMIMGLLPVVGIPLPLVSYGGSSLLTTIAAIGILMNIRMRRFQTKR